MLIIKQLKNILVNLLMWRKVLKKAGYSTTALTLDFETYFDDDYSLKKLSTVEYIFDSRFEITGLGIQKLDNPIEFYFPNKINFLLEKLKTQFGSNLEKCTLVGQNLKFDALILWKFGITPKYTVDIRDLSRHLDARNKHSLEALAKRWDAPKLKGDTKQFKGLHWADMNQEQKQTLEEYGKGDIEIETFLFKKLLPLISNPQLELPLATQTLHLYLNPQIQIDFELGEKLKKEMRLEMVKPLKDLYDLGIDCSEQEISGDISFLNLLNQHLDKNEQVPMKQGKNGAIPALAREDEGMKYLLEKHHNKKVRALAAARLAISSWPLHIKRVKSLENQAKTHNGKIGGALTYYAGHTGRWGGTEGTNLCNLGGRGRKGKGTHPLIREVRHMLCAPDAFVFGLGDFAQIEFRINAWFSGQEDILQAFREGRDLYSEFATEDLFKQPIRKPQKDDPEPLARMLTFKRGFAKDGMLGFGYGMGTNRLYSDCRANDALRPAFDSGEYDWDFIDKLIKKLRARYFKIPEFWRTVEKAWKFVTKYPKERFLYDIKLAKPAGMIIYNPCLDFYNQNGTTIIQLPSGRNLYYPKASVNKWGDLLYRWGKLWGGSITENIVQSVARDILAEALLRLEDAGFNILWHVYDEVICLLLKSSAEKDLQKMIEIMEIVPDWAQGLPIAVEGKLSERYKK